MERGPRKDEQRDRRAKQELLDRLLRALGHPQRRRIMAALGDHEGSAKTLAVELDAPLQNISYHLNKVLAEECQLVKLVGRFPRRGAEEKVYRLDHEAVAAALAIICDPAFSSSFGCSSPDPPAEPG